MVNKKSKYFDRVTILFYSSLALDRLILKDLGTMLTQTPINIDKPYIYAPSLQMTPEAMQRFYNIEQFESKKVITY